MTGVQTCALPISATGAGLSAIDRYVGINNDGMIAFTGRDADGSKGFVTSSPDSWSGITFFGSTRTFLGATINNESPVNAVFRTQITGPYSLIRKWAVDGSSSTTVGYSFDGDFNTAYQFVDINDNGVVCFTATTEPIGGNVNVALFAGNSQDRKSVV